MDMDQELFEACSQRFEENEHRAANSRKNVDEKWATLEKQVEKLKQQ